MNKLRLFIDFDGTIANSDIGMGDYYNEYFHHLEGFVPADGTKIKEWNAKDQCPLMSGKDIGKLFNSDFFWHNLTIKEGCIEVIEKLCADERFEVIILSVGQNINKSKKAKFIEKHFPMVKEVMLISGNIFNKNEITDKSIVIDDHEDNLMNLNAYKILFYDRGERDFNQKCNEDYRATNWEEVYDRCIKVADIMIYDENN